MNLHGIRPKGLDALVWMVPIGRNGKALAKGHAHLYRLLRATPPQLGSPDRRYTTTLWSANETNPLLPICGPIKTRSTRQWIRTAYEWYDKCPSCTAEAKMEKTYAKPRELNLADPWSRLMDRQFTPDPVTGL